MAEEKVTVEQVDVAIDPDMKPDWPSRSGDIDLALHDLPHLSSVTEWWYFNSHLTTVSGRKLSVFVCFFRTVKGQDENGMPVFADALNWAIVDVENEKYINEVFLDKSAPEMIRRNMEMSGKTDRRMRKAMEEILNKGNVPLPDKMFKQDTSVSMEKMDLDFVHATCTKTEEGAYVVSARHTSEDSSVQLTFTPEKGVVRHGHDGVVKLGGDGGNMFYYFFPRCTVSGSVTVKGEALELDAANSSGWYDHEFGGSLDADVRIDSAWNWASVQLDNGYEITAYTLANQESKATLEEAAIVIDPSGERVEYPNMALTPTNSWTSLRSFREYPTKYTLSVPEADVELTLEASFEDQEFMTLIAKPAFWEGRCEVSGTMGGQPVSGVCFVERNGYGGGMATLETFFKNVGKVVRAAVRDAYPDRPTYEQARELVATPETDHYMDGVPLDILADTLLKPVREVADRGGKSWRSYAALACSDIVGGDPRRLLHWLPMPEFLHVGSLIVDDIQDKSETRRGGPCSHLIYGEPLCINAGTAAYFQTQQYLAAPEGITAEELNRLYSLYFAALRGAHAGQALDIHGLDYMMDDVVANGGGALLERRVLAIHRLKTAVPAGTLSRMGALVGGGSEEQIEAVGMFMEAVGIAFQIMDDVLNLRGLFTDKADLTPGKALKTLGEDIMCGKVTMPVAKAMAVLDLEARTQLWETVRSKPQEREVVDAVIAQLEEIGAVEACVEQANSLVEAAWAKLDPLVEDSFSKLMLRSFSWFVIDRHH